MLKRHRMAGGVAAITIGLTCGSWAVQAQAPARVPDAEVKVLVEQVERGINRFVDGMNPQMRTAVLKSETSEIRVKEVLDDLKTAAKAAREAYAGPGGGASQVTAFLAMAKKFDAGLALRPGMSGADARWSDLVPTLGKLAEAYRVDWAGDPASWTGRRTSDAELKNSGAALKKTSEEFAKKFNDAVKKDKALDKAAKQNIAGQLAAFTAATKGVEELLKSGSDASMATTRALKAAADLETLMNNFSGKAAVSPAWAAVNATLNNVARAYGLQ